VKVTRGEDNIGTYNKTDRSYRKWCKTCDGHVLHEETVLRIRDGLPKMADIPAELGGSGRTLPE
jgi:hypothetical protein